mmetsp:Transcript_25869/g.64623  ORF Transcript_25869/g.64623 Transcript_25869/m.64623 type:complete len:250 (-) Transcript_25869:438-1187(-)
MPAARPTAPTAFPLAVKFNPTKSRLASHLDSPSLVARPSSPLPTSRTHHELCLRRPRPRRGSRLLLPLLRPPHRLPPPRRRPPRARRRGAAAAHRADVAGRVQLRGRPPRAPARPAVAAPPQQDHLPRNAARPRRDRADHRRDAVPPIRGRRQAHHPLPQLHRHLLRRRLLRRLRDRSLRDLRHHELHQAPRPHLLRRPGLRHGRHAARQRRQGPPLRAPELHRHAAPAARRREGPGERYRDQGEGGAV